MSLNQPSPNNNNNNISCHYSSNANQPSCPLTHDQQKVSDFFSKPNQSLKTGLDFPSPQSSLNLTLQGNQSLGVEEAFRPNEEEKEESALLDESTSLGKIEQQHKRKVFTPWSWESKVSST